MGQYDKVLEVVTNFWFLLLIAYVGILLNFLNNQIKGESLQEIKAYLAAHIKSVISSWLTTSVSYLAYYLALSTGQVADVITVLMIGYACDSLFDKIEMKKKKIAENTETNVG